MTFLNPISIIRRRLEEANASVTQCTWDQEGEKAIRLQLVPPHPGLRRRASLLHINGQHIIPLNHGNATLLRFFMQDLSVTVKPGEEVPNATMMQILTRVSRKMKSYYPEVPVQNFATDLGRLQDLIQRVALGGETPELEGQEKSMADYASSMRAPFRMDLAVMPMRIDGVWSCPLACAICYANKGEAMKVTESELLTTRQWFKVLDLLWKAGVPAVSFTGGDPLAREDIVQLVDHAQEFVTRLNTSAVLLTSNMARQLHKANLDVMQVTVYSFNAAIHDGLVGRAGALASTLNGIRFAIEAEIEVSVNTPLVVENVDGYTDTIRFLHDKLGVRYFTASGMLPAGGAKVKIAAGGGVQKDKLFAQLKKAKTVAESLDCELDFTSPGCLNAKQLGELKMNMPVCGASLGNMAIAPDGEVLPCQSWVHDKKSLGNILTTSWKKIWDNKLAKRIRATAVNKNACPLAEEV